MLATLCAQDFQPLEKKLCQLTIANDCTVAIELAQVVENPQTAMSLDEGTRIPFSLLFKMPLEEAFDVNYCHFHHPSLGVLENMFINRILPLNPRENAAWYQIVFA